MGNAGTQKSKLSIHFPNSIVVNRPTATRAGQEAPLLLPRSPGIALAVRAPETSGWTGNKREARSRWAAHRGDWGDSGPSPVKHQTVEGGGGRRSGLVCGPGPSTRRGPAPGAPAASPSCPVGRGAASGSPTLSRLSPGADADSGVVLSAQWRNPAGTSRDTSPSPTGLVPSGSQVPPHHRGPDKMEDVVSSRSHDGRWCDCSPRGEARVDVRPPQEHSGTPSPAASLSLGPAAPPALRQAQGLKELDREGAGDIEAASLPGQGR